MKNYFIYNMPSGKIAICEEDGKIKAICTSASFREEGAVLKETPLLKTAALQLECYFKGTLKNFDLPLAPDGTPFQKSVWAALMQIPYGKTASYKDIANKIKNPKAVRAVGGANNKNPIFIVIPCHRVIGADGCLVGYGGGLEMKKLLLATERYFG